MRKVSHGESVDENDSDEDGTPASEVDDIEDMESEEEVCSIFISILSTAFSYK